MFEKLYKGLEIPHGMVGSPIAQSVERTAVNREVAGSRPAGRGSLFSLPSWAWSY